jgi:O-acetylhomoserine/O-acetylserine sulfhydrylase-like pyridoxal-dependent enzyme
MSRPDKHDPARLGFSTQAVHGGNEIDAGTGALRTPIVMANSYALPEDPSAISWSGTDVPLYTRNSGTNQLGLQRKLALLEVLAERPRAYWRVLRGTQRG